MKTFYIPYEKAFDDETSTWNLTGKDSQGRDFGVASAPSLDGAIARLYDWILDSLVAAADDGHDPMADLSATVPQGPSLALTPLHLVPIRIRRSRVRQNLSQAYVAERLGITQQAYSKFERPGANLGLRTIQQVEGAIDEELLEFA